MPRWSTRRIALLGDAAFAPSLLAGQGAALAIIAAYVLAGELARAERPQDGFGRYEETLRPFIEAKQRGAARFAGSFVPKTTRMGLFLRNRITKAFALPYVAALAMGATLRDDIELPTTLHSPRARGSSPTRGAPDVAGVDQVKPFFLPPARVVDMRQSHRSRIGRSDAVLRLRSLLTAPI